jgi:MFS superfamily sulfate permease-like transporter
MRGVGYPRYTVVLTTTQKEEVTMSTILLLILVLVLVGALPTWPYSREWGYYPSGLVGVLLVVIVLLVLTGRLG